MTARFQSRGCEFLKRKNVIPDDKKRKHNHCQLSCFSRSTYLVQLLEKRDSGQFPNHQSKTHFSKNSTRKKLIHSQPYIFFHLSVYSLEKNTHHFNFNTSIIRFFNLKPIKSHHRGNMIFRATSFYFFERRSLITAPFW
jgi:hypothetical protein